MSPTRRARINRHIGMGLLWITLAIVVGTLVVTERNARQSVERQADRADQIAYQSALNGCFRGRARTMRTNRQAKAFRLFLAAAADARMASYHRQGFASDLHAARQYRRLIGRVQTSPLTNCRKAYPPPRGNQ